MKSKLCSIENLNNYYFVIPINHREYMWLPDKQVTVFFENIKDAFVKSKYLSEEISHYIGC